MGGGGLVANDAKGKAAHKSAVLKRLVPSLNEELQIRKRISQ